MTTLTIQTVYNTHTDQDGIDVCRKNHYLGFIAKEKVEGMLWALKIELSEFDQYALNTGHELTLNVTEDSLNLISALI